MNKKAILGGKKAWVAAFFLTTIFLFALPRSLAETASFDTFIPDTALVYVSVINITETRENFKQTNLYKLWEEEETQNAFQSVADKVRQGLQEAEQEIGISFKEIAEMFTGEAAFVFLDLESKTVTTKETEVDWDAVDFEKFDFETGELPQKEVAVQETEFVPYSAIIADIGENQAGLEEVIERALDAAGEEGPSRKTSEIYGVAINILEDKKDPSIVVAYAFMDSLFIATWGVEALERMIVNYKTKVQAPLSRNLTYRYVVSKLDKESDVVFFLNNELCYDLPLGEFAEEFFSQFGPPQSPGQAFGPKYQIKNSFRSMEEAAIRALGGGISLAPEKTLLVSYAYAPGIPKGTMKIYPTEIPPAKSLTFTPREAFCYLLVSMDFQEYWKQLKKQFDAQFAETGMDFFGQVEAQLAHYEEEFGFSLEEDLLGSMGNEAGLFVIPKSAYDAEGTVAVVVFGALDNSARFEDCLTKIRDIPLLSFFTTEEQDYLGYKINVFSAPPGPTAMPPGEAEAPPLPEDGPAYAVTDDFFFFSSSSVLLKAVLRSLTEPTPSIQENDLFRKATADFPPQPLYLFYADLGQLLDQIYPFISELSVATGREASLPSLEALKKHLTFISATTVRDENGILSITVLP